MYQYWAVIVVLAASWMHDRLLAEDILALLLLYCSMYDNSTTATDSSHVEQADSSDKNLLNQADSELMTACFGREIRNLESRQVCSWWNCQSTPERIEIKPHEPYAGACPDSRSTEAHGT